MVMNTLYNKIKKYTNSDVIPMHMPGHKRNAKLKLPFPIDIDITEIDGFDNLHNMEGLLKDISNNIAKTYGTNKSFMLVNGTSGGILSAIYSQTNYSDKIIVARNCHKSVYNIIEIKHLHPIYIMPEFIDEYNINGQINPYSLEQTIKQNLDAKCVVITSPTYEGVSSDIESIAKICHNHNMLLIVDEAHGAHLGFDNRFPKSARQLGADIVINSLHKTMPALTQCAVAHICSKRVNVASFEKALSMFETSSPSYILMSSIDYCVKLVQSKGQQLFDDYYNNLTSFYKSVSSIKNLKVVNNLPDFDFGKIIISTIKTNLTGIELAKILREQYKIEIEMASTDYIIAMTTIADSQKNFDSLASAILNIDKKCNTQKTNNNTFIKKLKPLKKYCEVYECDDKNATFVDLIDSLNCVSLEYVWVYPPGIPIIVPGEIISQDIINLLLEIKASGLEIKSDKKQMPKKIFAKKI